MVIHCNTVWLSNIMSSFYILYSNQLKSLKLKCVSWIKWFLCYVWWTQNLLCGTFIRVNTTLTLFNSITCSLSQCLAKYIFTRVEKSKNKSVADNMAMAEFQQVPHQHTCNNGMQPLLMVSVTPVLLLCLLAAKLCKLCVGAVWQEELGIKPANPWLEEDNH